MSRMIGMLWFCAAVCLAIPAALSAKSLLPYYKGEEGRFVVDHVYGGNIDDPDNFFFQPTSIALDSHGNLFVLDTKGFQIKKFAPDGSFLAAFGGKGEGPGEMVGAYLMAVNPGDTIAIFDTMNSRRFSFFDGDGSFLRAVSLTEFGYKNITDFDFDPRGRLFIRVNRSDYFRPGGQSVVSVALFDLDARREQPIDSLAVRDMYSRQDKNNWQMASTPYQPSLYWAVAPSGNIITADSGTYRIRIYSPDLALICEHRIEGRKRPVTEEDKRDYFASFTDDDTEKWLRRTAKFPDRKPWFDRFFVDDEGYILLCIDDVDENTQLFDVLDPEGERIGTVELPALGHSAIIASGSIYTTGIQDEEDYVVRRYRLEQAH